jgi:hypothetical protein
MGERLDMLRPRLKSSRWLHIFVATLLTTTAIGVMELPLALHAARLPIAVGVVTAEAYCWDMSCQYQDPSATGCDADAITVDALDGLPTNQTLRSYGYWIQLRYSPNNCGANWGRSQADLCNPSCYSGVHFVSWQGSAQYGVTIGLFNDADLHWTYMLSGASSSDKVCENEDWTICTAWH